MDQPQPQQPLSLQVNPLKYLNKVPEFYGNSCELQTFIDLIDRVHPFLQTFDAVAQSIFSDVIKSRLKGRARETIDINCQAVSWTEIKAVLQNAFGDKRTCEELFDELRGVTFKTNSVEYFNEIKTKLRRLNNKTMNVLGTGALTNECVRNNMKTALNIFKNKIPEPMKTILVCRNPDTLENAMDILFQSGYAYMTQTKHFNKNSDTPRSYSQFDNTNRKPNSDRNLQPNYPRNNQNQPRSNNFNNYNTSNNNNAQPRRIFYNNRNNNNNHYGQPPFNTPFNRMNRTQPNGQPQYQNFNNNNFRQNIPNNDSNNISRSSNNNVTDRPEPMDVNTHENLNFRIPASEETYHI